MLNLKGRLLKLCLLATPLISLCSAGCGAGEVDPTQVLSTNSGFVKRGNLLHTGVYYERETDPNIFQMARPYQNRWSKRSKLQLETLFSVSVSQPVYGDPVQYQGTLLVPAGNKLASIDALSGKSVWTCDLSKDLGFPKTVVPSALALFNGNVIFGAENELVFLDQKTGDLVGKLPLSGQKIVSILPELENCKACTDDGKIIFFDPADRKVKSQLNVGAKIVSAVDDGSELMAEERDKQNRPFAQNFFVSSAKGDIFYIDTIGDSPNLNALAHLNANVSTELVFSCKGGESLPFKPNPGLVLLGTDDGRMIALSQGKIKWTMKTASPIYSSPAVHNLSAFFGSDDGYIYCLDIRNGNVQWKFKTGGKVRSSPALADGLLYAGCDDGKLYVLDAESGALRCTFQAGGPIDSSPTVVVTPEFQQISVGSTDGKLYILGISSESRPSERI